jgi:hypothetical protein
VKSSEVRYDPPKELMTSCKMLVLFCVNVKKISRFADGPIGILLIEPPASPAFAGTKLGSVQICFDVELSGQNGGHGNRFLG